MEGVENIIDFVSYRVDQCINLALLGFIGNAWCLLKALEATGSVPAIPPVWLKLNFSNAEIDMMPCSLVFANGSHPWHHVELRICINLK